MDKLNKEKNLGERNEITNKTYTENPKSNSADLKATNQCQDNNNSEDLKNKSKIPQREKSILSTRDLKLVPPQDKKFSLKNKSKTSFDAASRIGLNSCTKGSASLISPSITPSLATVSSSPRHRFGEVPSYLRRPDKLPKDTGALSSKKRLFNVLRKKVADQQQELLAAYKSINDLYKSAGVEEPLEELKLVAVVVNDNEEILVKNGDTSALKAVKHAAVNKDDASKLLEIKKKLECVCESDASLCQEFLDSVRKFPELGIMVGDGSDMDKKITEVVHTIEPIAQNFQKQHISFTNITKELELTLQAAMQSQSPRNETTNYSLLLKEKDQKIAKLTKALEENSQKQFAKSRSRITEQSAELEENLCKVKTDLAEKEMGLVKAIEMIKELEGQRDNLEKKIEQLCEENTTKADLVKQYEDEIEGFRSRSQQNEAIMDDVQRQKENILEFVKREQEARKLYENEHEKCIQLEGEVSELMRLVDQLKDDIDHQKISAALAGGDRQHLDNDLWAEYQNLRASLDRVTREKMVLEQERETLKTTLEESFEDTYKIELCKANQEIKYLTNANSCLKETVAKMEQKITSKISIISDLEKKVASNFYSSNASKDIQNELNNLRDTVEEKKREIETLKCELSRAKIEMKQQEETICMHQRLLRIRSELINTLQEKEATNRCRMEDLYSEISKKTTLISQGNFQMNTEMSAKAEELQNLFSTLGTKQLELSRLEHTIKMLEESNERSQRLRVKQEEKISRLEAENVELKHILSGVDNIAYCENCLYTNNNSDTRFFLSQKPMEFERKKKRQTELEVKKIEK